MKQLIFLLFVISLCSSCEQWEPLDYIDANGLLVKIENEQREIISEYSYYNNGTLKTSKEYSSYYSPGSCETFNYYYNKSGQLTSMKGFQPGNMLMSSMTGAMDKNLAYRFAYDATGQLDSINIDFIYDDMDDLNYSMCLRFSYPDEQTCEEIITFKNSYASTNMITKTYHFDENGNIAELKSWQTVEGKQKLYSIEEMQYDDHKSPVTFKPLPQSKNNVLEKSVTVYNYDENNEQTVAYSSTYVYEYEYNGNGYPSYSKEIQPNQIENIRYYHYK
ncbi:hypothetical protein [Roseimarinus sediminis]|jgi:hypothetical protein|uniref:hypothetical protein n=1 Tax=Roseimarinus sediminis TaxID=1610899 RepID=UPI003D1AB676